MHASFEERSAWVTLIGLSVVSVGYAVVAIPMLADGVEEVGPYLPLMITATLALVVLLATGHVLAAIGGIDVADERDRLIAWRAEHHSAWLVGAGALAAVFALASPLSRASIANGLLAAVLLSELANYGLQLFFYRRGV